MNMQEVKLVAKEKGIRIGSLKKVELIRAVQVSEGNDACYATGKALSCGQKTCLWKDDCN